MICTTIQNRSLEEILDLLEKEPIRMAEIRLDRCPLTTSDIETLFSSSDTPLVATCRVAGDGSGTWSEAEEKLLAAIGAGAAFADLEIEAPPSTGKKIRRACTEWGTVMIRSCHWFDGTPSKEELEEMVSKCAQFGGEIVKIVTTASSTDDCERVESLYESCPKGSLVAFAMGEAGKDTRIGCLKRGAPFTYAALSSDEAAAPGQWDFKAMEKAVYGDQQFIDCKESVNMPASKSFAQRAIVAAALAQGESVLEGYSPCGDSQAALEAAKALGAVVDVEGSTVRIKGTGGKTSPLSSLFVGESGLLARLMIPVVAALSTEPVLLEGCGTLPRRPLRGAAGIMAACGTVLKPKDLTSKEPHIPLTVYGPLLPCRSRVSGKEGSQLISGLLMALPLLEKDSSIFIEDPKSIPYMFITTDVLRNFGIRISSEMEGNEDFAVNQDWADCTGISFRIKGSRTYRPASFRIEGDWSAAANFLVAGALFGKVLIDGLDTTSLQADISIMDILMEAGASLSQIEGDGGHCGTIVSQTAPLRAFHTDLNNCPDLFPIVSVLAAFCPGESSVRGFKRLSGKESDRGKAILSMLGQMGVEANAEGDTLFINGIPLASRRLSGKLLRGGEYTSSHDHRMAMALSVAALGADSPVLIDDRSCVAKSYPAFFEDFAKLNLA